VARYEVHRSATAGFTPSAGTRIGTVTTPGYTDGGLAAGTYHYRVIAVDAAGNAGPASSEASAVVTGTPTPGGGGPREPVAAYGFEETVGSTTADASGTGNTGTLNGPARSAGGGRFGNALAFDGTNDLVTVPDSASLDVTTGLTMEAWVYPTTTSGWRTVLLKEQPGNLLYALYANTTAGFPDARVFAGADLNTSGTAKLPTNTWSHLAATYDGAQLTLYVNGAQVSRRAVSGPIATSARPLQIGGNTVWNEWFKGRIDEVRVYDRALDGPQIQADMTTPVGPGS
jgi:hypothetical protein